MTLTHGHACPPIVEAAQRGRSVGWIALNTQFTDEVVDTVIDRADQAFADLAANGLIETPSQR